MSNFNLNVSCSKVSEDSSSLHADQNAMDFLLRKTTQRIVMMVEM